ncbi:hypothetical protein FRC15_000899 [Serendipita sp. 397]|nr:hypothetical protein FRC15_000899 [Serendipita sp. 397]
MCHDGNSAGASQRYLNAQITALYQTAYECVQSCSGELDFKSASYDRSKYTRSLAQYHFVGPKPRKVFSTAELFFSAQFDQPRLTFICNHEAIFYLHVREGHYNLDYQKANVAGYRVEAHKNRALKDITVAFRMKFSRTGIKGSSSKIGNGSNHLIQLMILDFGSAKLQSFRPTLAHEDTEALTFYLRNYLQFLENVRALCRDEVILTYTIDSIAFFKTDDWSKETPEEFHNWQIAFIVDVSEEKECDGAVTRLVMNLETARFSHHFSVITETSEVALGYFYQIVHFLSVDYLDVITQYKMHRVWHHDTRVITVTHTAAPIQESSDENEEMIDEEGSAWKYTATDKKWQRRHGQLTLWHERIEKTTMFGYDQVLAISEESINQMFFSLWSRASKSEFDGALAKWSKEIFSASFEAIRVRLLSNGKAIVWIGIHDGQLRVKSESDKKSWWQRHSWKPAKPTDKTETHEFSDLSLAFEVNIKMEEQHSMTLSESWFSRFHLTHLFQAHADAPERLFKHLLFDFANATFRSELSNVDCLCEGKGRQVVDKLETAICYTRKYLVDLAHHGHNIIHTVPIFSASCKSLFGFTSVAHCIVAKEKVTVENCGHARKGSEAPAILIVGTCGGRQLTFVQPQWHAGLVICGSGKSQSSLGTVCLSKAAFLEGCLLKNLERVNATTTIVPNFAGVIDGQWNFDLTTWATHAFRKNRACKWKVVECCQHGEKECKGAKGCAGEAHGSLQYIWEHRDGWSHEHEGTSHDENDGQYSIDCRTRNRLTIPTTYRPGALEIKMKGESILTVAGKDECNEWSKQSTATWEASICIYSRPGGLAVQVTGSPKPRFAEAVCSGACNIDITKVHSQNLPQTVDFEDLLTDLRTTLQGTWEYSAPGHLAYGITNPVFTVTGDLVCQLASYDALMKKEIAVTTAAATTTTTTPMSPVRKNKSLMARSSMLLKTGSSSLLSILDGGLLTSSSSIAETPMVRTPSEAGGASISGGATTKQQSQSSFFSKEVSGYSVSEMKSESKVSLTEKTSVQVQGDAKATVGF